MKLQREWGVGEYNSDGVVIQEIADGTLVATFFGTRPAEDKSADSQKAYGLSKQRVALLVPVVNSFIIAVMILLNTRLLYRQEPMAPSFREACQTLSSAH